MAAPLDEISKIESFRHIEYLYTNGGFSRVSEKFEKIRLIRAACIDRKGLNDFCQDHPKLEVLFIYNEDQLDIALEDQWKLPNLKCLLYRSKLDLQKDFVEKLVQKCPNLEEFHCIMRERQPRGQTDAVTAIAFERLKMLNIDGMDIKDGSFLLTLPQLESLFLRGFFECEKFLAKLVSSLPLSQHLRELRLEWYHKEEESNILDLIKSLSKMRTLERVALLTESCYPLDLSPEPSLPMSKLTNFPDFLVKFVSGLPHLVALCLFCFQLDTSEVEEISKKMSGKIFPSRPSFWFKIGSSDVKPDFSDAPHIHRYGIVELRHPSCYYPNVL